MLLQSKHTFKLINGYKQFPFSKLMDYYKLSAVATIMIAFSTFLGVLAAFVYYAYIMVGIENWIGIVTLVNLYIFVNLLFLYIIWRLLK